MKKLIVLFSLLLAGAANAAMVNVTATGTFTEVTGDASLLPFAVPAPGTQFVMTFSYDDQAFDATVTDPDTGLFFNTVMQASLMIGSDSFLAIQPGTILIVNDGIQDGNPDGADLWNATARLYDDPGSDIEYNAVLALLNTEPVGSIPLPPLDSGELVAPFLSPSWDVAALRFRVDDDSLPPEQAVLATAEAAIDSISIAVVPLPATALLFASSLGLVAGLRRRPSEINR